MFSRTVEFPTWLYVMGAMLLPVAGTGCAGVDSGQSGGPVEARVDPVRVYASYRFDRAPTVLSFGVQPLWIPTCVIWEVMARDEQLQEELRRTHCRLNVYPFYKGRDMSAFLAAGKLQGGMIGDLPTLKAATELDVRIVSLIQQGPCSIVAREGQRLGALRGHAIGYAPGSNAHYTLLLLLREQGLRPREVRLMPMEATDMTRALAARQIDAFSAWEPTPSLAMLDHPDFNVIAQTDARGYLSFTRRFMERYPLVVRAMVASEIRALRWLRTNDKNLYIASGWARQRAVAFGGTELPLTVYDFLRLARRDLLRFSAAPRLLPELLALDGALSQQFQVSREMALISPSADWDRVRRSFAVALVPRILAAPADYHLDSLRLGRSLAMSGPRSAASGSGRG